MSDIANPLELKRSSPQLPVSWYFDQQMLELEQKLLFANGPGYIGHELMVPNEGDYHTLAWMDHAKLLIRNAQGVELLSNVCRHRQAMMLEGRGNARNVVCPLHRWTYDTRGELLGAPHFADNPCLNLHKTPLQNWNGLLFTGKHSIAQDLSALHERADLDFSGYMLDRVHIHECNYNWKTFIEVYLEDYHVVPFHPGSGKFCHLRRSRAGSSAGAIRCRRWASTIVWPSPAAPTYERWQKSRCSTTARAKARPSGAIWLTSTRTSWSSGIRTCWWCTPCTRAGRRDHQRGRVLLSGGYGRCSSANSSRPSRPPIWETAIEDDESRERMDRRPAGP